MVDRLGSIDIGGAGYFFRLALASVAMGILCLFVWHLSIADEWIRLAVTTMAGLLCFLYVSFLLQIKQAQKIFYWLKEYIGRSL